MLFNRLSRAHADVLTDAAAGISFTDDGGRPNARPQPVWRRPSATGRTAADA